MDLSASDEIPVGLLDPVSWRERMDYGEAMK